MIGIQNDGLPRLATSESTAMPDISAALPWRSWHEGQAEAMRRQLPLLVVAEPDWANSAQRLAAKLAEDDRLRAVCCDLVVPVLVDPTRDDAPVDRWRVFSVLQAGTIGPPLILLMSDESLPLLSFTSLAFEGNKETPSLWSVVQATHDAWQQDAAGMRAECRALNDAISAPVHDEGGGPWSRLESWADLERGGLETMPRHPHPQVLLALLGEPGAMAKGSVARTWVETTLTMMATSGVRDQLDRGFFRCGRDERWVAPHFEKPVPLSAQLAATYAQAAIVFERRDFRDLALELMQFSQIALRQGADRIASESRYYTWTAQEVREAVSPATLQVVCLHFGIIPGPHRYALHQSVTEAGLERFGNQSLEEKQAALAQGRAQLASARKARPAPSVAPVAALKWRAETIRWLYETCRWDLPVDLKILGNALDTLTASVGDGGYRRADGSAMVEDQAAILGALLAAHNVDGDARWHERASALASIIVRHYVSGGVVHHIPQAQESARPLWNVVDGEVPASLPTLVTGLRQVAQLDDDPRLAGIADAIAEQMAGLVRQVGPWAASAWGA